MSSRSTCHACRNKVYSIMVCDFCDHLVCGNCILGVRARANSAHHDGDAICDKCIGDKKHRTCHEVCRDP